MGYFGDHRRKPGVFFDFGAEPPSLASYRTPNNSGHFRGFDFPDDGLPRILF
jgi:hypothetical protein